MKKLISFLKITLLGGLLVVLPIWLVVLLLLKAINAALVVVLPIAKMLPQQVVHEAVVASGLLLAICFLAGLLMRVPVVQRWGRRLELQILERLPGYTVLRGLTRQVTGMKDEQSFQPALVEIEDALVPAFIVEKHADGQFTVFVSSSPTPLAGAIYILPPARVHPVDLPLPKALGAITKWGAGTDKWRAAMRP